MKLIVGLGNPGKEYEHTRHNVGFEVLDLIASNYNVTFKLDSKLKGLVTSFTVGSEKVILLKPITFMNLSGESVQPVMNFYKIPLEEILVIYDDIALDLGRLRLRESGSAGGHNGMKSVILHAGGQNFKRIRVGIADRNNGDLCHHVLGKFTADEYPVMLQSFKSASEAIKSYIEGGQFVNIMTKYNTPGV